MTATLIAVTGAPGTGKTTLAHALAQEIGCPAIIRDEIKQGMVMGRPGYRAGGDNPLNHPTLEVFFQALKVLLQAGVTVVAEAAYQDRLWRPNLEPLAGLADIRVIRCTTASSTAHERIAHRAEHGAHRSAHADFELLEQLASGERSLDAFVGISLDVPTLTVDTTDGYRPGIQKIVSFACPPAAARSENNTS